MRRDADGVKIGVKGAEGQKEQNIEVNTEEVFLSCSLLGTAKYAENLD